jgi:glyoxylase-like metal-dependent hydrolase (beta-lactamase superfamily II)
MNRILKTGLKVVAGILAVTALGVGALAYSIFGGMAPIVDGVAPAPEVRLVKDGFVVVGIVDVGAGKVILVDAGNDPTGKAILAELSRRHLSADAVRAIFLTHGHPDHSAGVHLFPSAAVYALSADVALAEGREGAHGPITHLMSPHPNGTHITRALHDDETVVVGSASVRVFAVPGHTAGSAAYLVDDVLFLGDSAGLKSNGTLAGAPWAASDDLAQNHASLKALADRLRPEQVRIVAIVPAHSGMSTFDPLAQYTP